MFCKENNDGNGRNGHIKPKGGDGSTLPSGITARWSFTAAQCYYTKLDCDHCLLEDYCATADFIMRRVVAELVRRHGVKKIKKHLSKEELKDIDDLKISDIIDDN